MNEQNLGHKAIAVLMRAHLQDQRWDAAWFLLKHLQRDYALRSEHYIDFGTALAKHNSHEHLEQLAALLRRNPVYVAPPELARAQQHLQQHPPFKPIYDLLAEYKEMS